MLLLGIPWLGAVSGVACLDAIIGDTLTWCRQWVACTDRQQICLHVNGWQWLSCCEKSTLLRLASWSYLPRYDWVYIDVTLLWLGQQVYLAVIGYMIKFTSVWLGIHRCDLAMIGHNKSTLLWLVTTNALWCDWLQLLCLAVIYCMVTNCP